jgi:hypothetical protein
MDRPSPERRAQLNALKLSALVRDATGCTELVPGAFPSGAALQADGQSWVLLDEQPARALGGALAWATRRPGSTGRETLNILAESGTGVLARRAAEFAHPVKIWHVDGRTVAPATPEPALDPIVAHADHLAIAELIERGGAVVRVEHGVVAGEVEGLEVCRVVDDPHTGVARLEVGVGVHDREAFAMLHGDIPPVEAVARVVEAVRPHRTSGADPHPLNRLGAERSLRERALDQPRLIGAAHLAAAEPPVPRTNVKDPVPCVAVGSTETGRALVAVFSSGVDLDVVPFAADARRFHHGDDRDVDLAIIVPERDRLPVTVALAALLVSPAEVVPWRG